jgi:hypothetical protein
MVSDETDFENRTVLTAKISSLRAEIYHFSGAVKSSGRFLTKGDIVFILGFDKGSDGKDVVEFRSVDNPSVDGWLKCSDLDCDEL